MFATQVLRETFSDDLREEDDVEVVGFIVVDQKNHEVKKGETKIGRDSSMCSIVIENSTISKVHAVIESDGINDTFIYDAGSTNQTRLGKKVLKPHCRYKLDTGSNLTFGSVVVKFVIPCDKRPIFIVNNHDAATRKLLDEYEDIFDVATQAQIYSSSKGDAFENQSKNFQNFKIPNTKTDKYPEPSESIFDLQTQCQLNPQEAVSVTENHKSCHEPDIFSLPTQCQIYKPQLDKENSSETNSFKESEDLKSLLNDGEDDMLCAVMSLHSPNELGNDNTVTEKKIEIKSLSQILDEPIQILADIVESQEKKEKNELNSALHDEGFLVRSMPTTASTPLNNRLQSNFSENNRHTQECEEDFIKTEELKIKELHKEKEPGNLSQYEKTQLHTKENMFDTSTVEDKSFDEDIILPQNFETAGKNHLNKSTSLVIPESSDSSSDFMETQNYDVEQAKNSAHFVTEVGLSKSSEATVECTTRNDEHDFVKTQIFTQSQETTIKTGGSSERSVADDEDFIASPVELSPKPRPNKAKDLQEAKVSSRKDSLDLLPLKNPCIDSKDEISTKILEPAECHSFRSNFLGFSEKFHSIFSDNFKKNDSRTPKTKSQEIVESSGDETDSDLEILDKNEIIRKRFNTVKIFHKIEAESLQNHKRASSSALPDCKDSYVFELEPESNTEQIQSEPRPDSSDETDCEEIATKSPKIIITREPAKLPECEDIQVLASTSRKNFVEISKDCMTGEERPKGVVSRYFSGTKKCGAQRVSKEIQKIKERIAHSNENNSIWMTGHSEKKVHSPKKRPQNNDDVQIIEIKKFKAEDNLLKRNENQFSKLVKAHDITQIQPGRTRNSTKNFRTDRKTDAPVKNTVRSTSRTKMNTRSGNSKTLKCDIMPYLIKRGGGGSSRGEQTKETSPTEMESNESEGHPMVLRNSKRNSLSANNLFKPTVRVSNRSSRRSSRTKKNEYFSRQCVNIAFTGITCPALDKIISDLGGRKRDDLSGTEVVVADKVRRTVKLLCAIGLSLPIASPEWLRSCKKERKFLNPWNFILKDRESENKWDFQLKTSLERSRKEKLFRGFNVFATKNAKPPVKDLLAIVECCGGNPLFEPPAVWPKKTIIVSCLEDKKLWPPARLRNVQIVHYEFILTGVLRQKIDFKSHKLR